MRMSDSDVKPMPSVKQFSNEQESVYRSCKGCEDKRKEDERVVIRPKVRCSGQALLDTFFRELS